MAMNPFASAINVAAQTEDQTKEAVVEYRVPPAGKAMARFIEYVELGPQPQTWNGEKKPDCEEVRVAFELFGKKYTSTSADGEEIHDILVWKGKKKLNSKSPFFKLMKKMTYGREGITHMAQMLGEAFVVEVKHNTSERNGKEVTYANLFMGGDCYVAAPVKEDPETNETVRLNVPNPTRPFRCFIWKTPTKECWDSIFIDGSRTFKEGDKEVTRSNNWMQETLQSSPAFPGSALEAMLAAEVAANGGLPPIDDSGLIGVAPSENTDEIPF